MDFHNVIMESELKSGIKMLRFFPSFVKLGSSNYKDSWAIYSIIRLVGVFVRLPIEY